MKIFFDTSALPESLMTPGHAFELLRDLADGGGVEVVVPEIVQRERQSQVLKELAVFQLSVAKMLGNSGALYEALRQQLEQLVDVLSSEGGTPTQAEKITTGFLSGLGAKIVSSQKDDLEAMWKLYFSGCGPFSSLKCRKDIPDAFVYLAAKSISKQNSDSTVYCVIHDGNLAKAVRSIPGCRVYPTLLELLESKVGKEALAELAWARVWEVKVDQAIDGAEKCDKGYSSKLDELVSEELPSWSLEDGLPGSGGVVMGGMAVEAGKYTIDWPSAESLGPGWVELPFTGTVSTEYEYGVHCTDSFRLPSRVRVQHGDFERDTIFDASCVAELSVTGRLFLKFTEQQVEQENWASASLEVNIDEVEVSESEDFDEEEEDYDWEPPGSEMFE